MKDDKKIPLTGLWKKTTKNGMEFLSGNLSPKASLLIFPNGYKQKETDPDYYIYLAPNEPKEKRLDTTGIQPRPSTLTNDDIPF